MKSAHWSRLAEAGGCPELDLALAGRAGGRVGQAVGGCFTWSLALSSLLAASASKTRFAGMPSATNRLLIGCTLSGIRPKTGLELHETDVNALRTSPRCRPPPSLEICMTPL